MGLSLFPARAAIGLVKLPTGQTLEVMMTPEFSRALSTLYEVIGGDSGESPADKLLAAGLFRQEVLDAFEVILPVAGADSMAVQIDSQPDVSAQVAGLAQQVASLQMEIASLGAYATLRDEIQQLRIELAAGPTDSGLAQQVADLRVALAMQEDPAAMVRYMQQSIAFEDFDSTNSKIVPGVAAGTRGGNVALASLLTALATSGLVINNTVP